MGLSLQSQCNYAISRKCTWGSDRKVGYYLIYLFYRLFSFYLYALVPTGESLK